ncbi:putative uncharacterized protein DDB_G0271982 [Drosophila guanche]|uniref:MADF domain-containing protein n=1 Tax=Drosophila guanche TaxID=7266 RepID=A0A3B0J6T2_DROGU|nr:putative uncharacterized protein DDB_G0271982 [Drosophila guanche]SPP77894.1 Hypothetical predicted protein [Drosophila guanche]
MEERRLDRARRDSAKSAAAFTLPSSLDESFNLRLAELYRQHECLWNTALAEHQNVQLKIEAWEAIASKLGSHLPAGFVRNRISALRHQLNVYKLQMIEHKMCPGEGTEPEKPYHMEAFAYLDTIRTPPETAETAETAETGGKQSKSTDAQPEGEPDFTQIKYTNDWSITKMVKQRLAGTQPQKQPINWSRLSNSAYSFSDSMQVFLDPQTATPPHLRARPGESASFETQSSMPGFQLVQERERERERDRERERERKRERERERERERARSKEKPSTAMPRKVDRREREAEDMELFRLQWAVREQMPSRRPSRPNAPQKPAPMPMPTIAAHHNKTITKPKQL